MDLRNMEPNRQQAYSRVSVRIAYTIHGSRVSGEWEASCTVWRTVWRPVWRHELFACL